MEKITQIKYYGLLCDVVEILEKYNIQYWIDGGTLLCCYRDDDLEWEHDIDIGIKWEEKDNVVLIQEEMEELGYTWGEMHPFYNGIKKDEIHCDIIYWHNVNDEWRSCWGLNVQWGIPCFLIDNFAKKSFGKLGNKEFFIPEKTEEYLSWYFGKNWKVPMTYTEYNNYQLEAKIGKIDLYEANIKRKEIHDYWRIQCGFPAEIYDEDMRY